MKSTVAPYETAAWCVRIVCTNGTTVRLTTYPFDLKMSNAAVYTGAGTDASAVDFVSSGAPSAIDIDGFVGHAGITREMIASGLFDGAKVFIFKANYLSPVEDYEKIVRGYFGKTTIEDGRYTVQCMSLSDALGQTVIDTYQAACTRTFGDAGCTVDADALEEVGAVTTATSGHVFRDASRGEAVGFFTGGVIRFTSGQNLGHKPQEIMAYAADGTITLFEPFFYVPQVGDTYIIRPGCAKTLAACKAHQGHVLNYKGFPMKPPASVYNTIGGLDK